MCTFGALIGYRREKVADLQAEIGHQLLGRTSIGKDLSLRCGARRPLPVAHADRRHAQGERARPETLRNRTRLVKRGAGGFHLTARGEEAPIIGESPS